MLEVFTLIKKEKCLLASSLLYKVYICKKRIPVYNLTLAIAVQLLCSLENIACTKSKLLAAVKIIQTYGKNVN